MEKRFIIGFILLVTCTGCSYSCNQSSSQISSHHEALKIFAKSSLKDEITTTSSSIKIEEKEISCHLNGRVIITNDAVKVEMVCLETTQIVLSRGKNGLYLIPTLKTPTAISIPVKDPPIILYKVDGGISAHVMSKVNGTKSIYSFKPVLETLTGIAPSK